jgi:hypothetical protein
MKTNEPMTPMQRYNNWQTVLYVVAVLVLAVVGVVPLRGCAESHTRKVRVRIEFMPEDADAVRQVIETLREEVR